MQPSLGFKILVVITRSFFKKKLNSLPTKHIGVHMNAFKRVHVFQIELEFGNVSF